MPETETYRIAWAIAALLLAAGSVQAADPLGSEFTYQAQLKLDGLPLVGQVDMRFTLHDAATLGNQVGTMVIFDGQVGNGAPVDVTDGLLTVSPDFGANVFDGTALWLEIEVRSPHDPTNSAPHTTLSPRQPLTAAPYALALPALRNTPADFQFRPAAITAFRPDAGRRCATRRRPAPVETLARLFGPMRQTPISLPQARTSS